MKTQIAYAHRVVNVFENEPGVAGCGIGRHAQALGTEILERPQQALIHFSFVRDVAAMAVGMMAVAGLIFNEHAPLAAVGQLTGQDLVGKRAHEAGQLALENFQRVSARVIPNQRRRETICQRGQIR